MSVRSRRKTNEEKGQSVGLLIMTGLKHTIAFSIGDTHRTQEAIEVVGINFVFPPTHVLMR